MWVKKMYRMCGTKALLNSRKQLQVTKIITTRGFASQVEEQKVNVNGLDINYVKTGVGSHPVLLLPGALGSGWTDFKPQIDDLDRSKMTIVAWDPPGYGKSRPPDRNFNENVFVNDARIAHDLMKILGFNEFSLIGWSGGGATALILAANYPKSVRKMIAVGASAYFMPSELELYESIKDMDQWSERMIAPLRELYGEDYLRKTWTSWIDFVNVICDEKNGDVCQDFIPRIRCPTLIIHGAKDPMVDSVHPHFLKNNIPGSQLKVFKNGGHNLHLRYPEEFNDLVTKFLLE